MLGVGAFPDCSEPRLVEHPLPPVPAAGQLLCQTLELGICGTDREILESKHPLVPRGESHLALGHECLARVVEIGSEVTQFSPGDLVVPVVRRAFDRGHPRADLLPFGSFTERGIVQEHGFSTAYWLDEPAYLFPVSPSIASVAVLTEPLSVAEKGVQEAWGIQRGRMGDRVWEDSPPRVLVTGLGPIAFASLLVCRCLSWPVTVTGRDQPDSLRAELACRFGAEYIPADRLLNDPVDVERDGFDLILECTGSDEVLIRVARWLASCGVMVWLGSSRNPHPRSHDLDTLIRNAVLRNHVHVGTVNAAPRDFGLALKHLEQLQRECPAELAKIVTHRVRLDESLWHYRNRVPQGIKTVVEYA